MSDEFDDALALANGYSITTYPSPAPAHTAGVRPEPGTAGASAPAPPATETADAPDAPATGPGRHGGNSGEPAGPPRAAASPATDDGFTELLPDLGLTHRHAPDWASAQDTAHHSVRPQAPQIRALNQVHGHTLAAPLTALTDLPAFDTAAMDGWAVSGPGPWHLNLDGEPPLDAETGRAAVLAGAQELPPLCDGLAVRIATGARIPDGTTAVLRAERGTIVAGQLRGPNPDPGADIRPRGQECRSGAELLPSGVAITPAVLGLAAAAGYDQLSVHPRPRVEVLVLGDELLRAGLPEPGRIRDALGPMVAPWLTALGADVLTTRHLGDDHEALAEAVRGSYADVLVTTGSTAAGPADRLRPVLTEVGAHLLVEGVAVRPGHPMLLAEIPGGPPLVGLPGNPLAAVAGLLTLAAPLLRALSGRPPATLPAATLAEPVRGHRSDTRLVPVCRAPAATGEAERVRPLEYTGPAMLRGLAGAHALAVVPPGGAQRGSRVRLLEMPRA